MPSKKIKESIEFLFEREKERVHFKEMNKRELFEKTKKDYKKFPPLFREICRIIIYVKNKSAENVSVEIINKINGLSSKVNITEQIHDIIKREVMQ